MGPTPLYGVRAKKTPFAHKANEYRLSGDIKKYKLVPVAPRGVYPRSRNFQGNVEVDAHHIFHPSTIWVRPLSTELVAENPPKKRLCHEANEFMSP